jgi:GNAT superfamily N-acetyltransferase
MEPIRIRAALPTDADFLSEMLYEAACWREPSPPPPRDEVLSHPVVNRYIEGWGRPGDLGVVAFSTIPVGAAWFRLFRLEEPGYGFVDEQIPELSVAVRRDQRGHGIGAALLEALIVAARERGHSALSLSVELDNPAVRLYRRLGFKEVASSSSSSTLLIHV